jgi:hypothetical protein
MISRGLCGSGTVVERGKVTGNENTDRRHAYEFEDEVQYPSDQWDEHDDKRNYSNDDSRDNVVKKALQLKH